MFLWNRSHYRYAYGMDSTHHRFPSAQICQHEDCTERAVLVWKVPPWFERYFDFSTCAKHGPHDTGDDVVGGWMRSNVNGGILIGATCQCDEFVPYSFPVGDPGPPA